MSSRDCWKNMKRRLRTDKHYQSYSICESWLHYPTFKDWYDENYVDGYMLTTNVFSDNNHYSPNECIFLPQNIRKFLTGSDSTRGNNPIGASYIRSKRSYKATINNPHTGKSQHLGYYSNADEAHTAWLIQKMEYATELKPILDKIDTRLYSAFIRKIANK